MSQSSFITTDKLDKAAFILKTIAHPTRIAIVDLLKNNNEISVNDLCLKLGGIDQSLISHHLATMKTNGVLSARREGRNIFYRLQLSEVLGVLHCIENCNIDL